MDAMQLRMIAKRINPVAGARMNIPDALSKSVLPTLCGLVAGGLLASAIGAFVALASQRTPVDGWLGFLALTSGMFLYSLPFTVPAALAIGWPAYSFLLSRGMATYASSAAIALVPAVVVWLVVDWVFGALAALYGICIAAITHTLQLRSTTARQAGEKSCPDQIQS